ncbi:MAG: gamma-glutamylcyclotransferase [Gemmatimonadales bacterium]
MPAAALEPVLRELNACLGAPPGAVRARARARAAALFGAPERLIVYGSLAPGRANQDQLASLGGQWTCGWVTGDRVPIGWGVELGYPAVRWRPGGERIEAWLLDSSGLLAAWDRLDAFEGAAYQRLLAPFETEAGIVAVGYLYAAAAGA